MATPKRIEEAEKLANELMEKLANPNPEPVPSPSPAEPPSPEPAPEPSPEPAPAEPAPEPAKPVEDPSPAPAPTDENTWKEKFLAMDGKYKAETAPALRENTSLRMTIADLKTQLATITSELAQLKSVPAPKAEPKPMPEDVATLGNENPEVINAINHFIETRVPQLIEEGVQARMKDLGMSFDNKLSQVTQMSFEDRLTSKVSNWKTLNEDKGFLDWLAVRPRYARNTKLDLLRSAVQDRDVDSVASFFEDYIKETTAPEPAPAAPKEPQKKIDKFVSPSTKPSAAPAQEPEVEIIAKDDIKKFYADFAKGKYRGREKEAADIETKINAAMLAGNVR